MASVLRVPRLCTHRPRSGSPLSFPQSFIAYPHPSYSSTWNRQVRKPERQVKEEAKQRARKAEKAEKAENTLRKKRKARMAFIQHDLRDAVHFSLVDAMRYIRAFEVGQQPTSAKYELAIRLRSLKTGPAIRNRLQLPHPVNTALRIAVICPTPSSMADLARSAGATIVGEDDLINSIKEGEINFDRLLCARQSAQKLNKAGVGRILGPKGLMPSNKQGTMIDDIARAVKGMVGGSEYREKLGVIRLAIGQLAHTPEELQRNIKAVMQSIKRDAAQLSDKISKEIHEVVLSSTRAPGFTLSGEFKCADSIPTSHLTLATF